ncbi:VWA domain-containing protein [Pseudonocardia sp. KRD-184]|uniref:VWA domain-containing protein n=1 Tax=Pseudonocardia oceani TaxID=2792013 RepID=A0ABS6UEG8_9PSEU|nr:VWA domain-containing protein [Pseudonocardia oceani]MBW0088044.1 VWA domain-containing protein [Pseudonocardia oceani]MBW0094461.1 VWA domain-containing protein [Pseudonocardia oceani]MBW0107515.1 VWA domain-containing protein [Pseudonocardia oceani]MBW0120422.1 VWA domain-containing protein [Pseudonocardia oceani]MBW0130620.1 VWA domain-containing protein [Pseudonocardia oceani]
MAGNRRERPGALAPHPLVAAARDRRRQRTGDLTHDVPLFGALLRDLGVPAPLSAVLRAVRAADTVPLERRADLQVALRSCLAASVEEAAVVDVVFGVFWSVEPPEVLGLADESGGGDDGASGTGDPGGLDAAGIGNGARRVDGSARRASWSSSGTGRRVSAAVPERDRRVEELARRCARALGTTRSRRRRPDQRGDLVDLRESLRHNLRYAGEVADLRRARQRRERARLVVLCDLSTSMQPYTPFFLAFVHALTKAARSVECAIFNVEVAMVTDVFRRMPLRPALAWLEHRSVSLAGGTRIGHSLHGFTGALEARGALAPTTTAIVLSDGWDVGDGDLLAREATRLRRQVGRLVWLDPHAAALDYRPQVAGLRTVWPFIDDYLDFSSVESLVGVVAHLEDARIRPRSVCGTNRNDERNTG